MSINQQDVNKMDNSKPSMSREQIQIAARRIMAQYEHTQRIDFFDHWLNKLGLTPIVAKLEAKYQKK